ncbi:MAG: glycoside hydrolase, partial [Saprospiraceae bacterium]
SHTDVHSAYAAVNGIRVDDLKPHIYRTQDDGKHWIEIVQGLDNMPINVVKEDPQRKGLLFAGSETQVYVSLDDGDHWQSLRLNMPATSIRDLVIKDDDLVVATHGRSFWILDDISSLRQLTPQLTKSKNILFTPQLTYRVRWNMNTDTPLPQEEPAGQNPPDGAIVNYYLDQSVKNISLEILDSKSQIIRKYSNLDTLYKIPNVNIPNYWIRPQQILSVEKGSHRFLWDLHYDPLNVPPSYPISAIYNNTAPDKTSPWIMPGEYTIVLNVDGISYLQKMSVKMDPRVKTSLKNLQLQHDLSMKCYTNILSIQKLVIEHQLSSEQEKEASTFSANFITLQKLLQESDQKPTNKLAKEVQNKENEFKAWIKKEKIEGITK